MKRGRLLATLVGVFWAASAQAAEAHFIVAAVAAVFSAVTTVAGAIGGAIGFAGFQGLTWAAAGRWLLRTALYYGISKLFGGKQKGANSVADRQASVLQLGIGEVPRECCLGRDATAGSYVDGFNWGEANQFETVTIALFDHPCKGLVGFWIADSFYEFAGNGNQPDFNNEDGDGCLEIIFRDGTHDTVPDRLLVSDTREGDDRWTENDVGYGVSYVVVTYKDDAVIFPQGRPLQQFRWLVDGAFLYDPRKDSTVAGGSGSHRWDTPSTHEWSENTGLCSSNFRWGIYSRGQRICGPARSFDESPAADAIVAANISAESVALLAGGSQARYVMGGVIRDDEPWISVEQDFADAMAGVVVERAGAISIDAGAARSVVATFTDGDIVQGTETSYTAKLPRDQLVNSVTASFADPESLYEESTVPVRRSLDDIAADGEVRELSLPLRFIRNGSRAQRIAEIKRRQSRRQRTARLTLGVKYMRLEPGDWVEWTSERYFGGATTTWVVTGVDLDMVGRVTLALREIATAVFTWTAATDELTDTRVVYLASAAPARAALVNFQAEMIETTGPTGTRPVALRATWNVTRDARITAIRIEYRIAASYVDFDALQSDPRKTEKVITGLVDGVRYEARGVPLTYANDGLPTAWREVEPLNLAPAAPPAPLAFDAWQESGGFKFRVQKPSWPLPLRTEILAGEFLETAYMLTQTSDIDAGPVLQPPPADGSNRFWARSFVLDDEGEPVYSESGLFFDLDVAVQPNLNELEIFDFQVDDWPGVAVGFTRVGSSGSQVLEMDAPGGIRPDSADYFQTVDLGAYYPNALWYFESLIAGRDASPPVIYDDMTFTYDAMAAWYPHADSEPVSEVRITPYIATERDDATLFDAVHLSELLTTTSVEGVPAHMSSITFTDGLQDYAFEVTETSQLNWEIEVPADFRLEVDFIPDIGLDWSVRRVLLKLVTSGGDNMTLGVIRDDPPSMRRLYLANRYFGSVVDCEAPDFTDGEPIRFSISQGAAGMQIAWVKPRLEGAIPTSDSLLQAPTGPFAGVRLGQPAAITYYEWNQPRDFEIAAGFWTYDYLGGMNQPDNFAANPAGAFSDLAIFTDELTPALIASLAERAPAGFGDYRELLAANYSTQRAVIRLHVEVEAGYGEGVQIDEAILRADMLDVFDGGTNNILAAGTRINFTETFTVAPTQINVTQISGATAAARYQITIDLLGFDIVALNSSSVAIDCGISWSVRGR